MNAIKIFVKIFFLLICLVATSTTRLTAQGTQTEFGKGRVQYQDFDWSEYESPNFMTYWSNGGRELGHFAVLTAEEELPKLQDLLEYRMNERIDLLVYTDLTTLKQSNIGNDEVFRTTGGTTKILGNKVFVYFDGNHANLRRSIREGIAQVLMAHMLFGDDFQEIVQNAVLLHLPVWFTQGLVSYTGSEWNTEMDNEMRAMFLSKNPMDFEELTLRDPKLAGHAMWYFIAQNYGKASVSNLLYLTRINRSLESGFLYVLGSSYGQTTDAWAQYFAARYAREQHQPIESINTIAIKKRQGIATQAKLSPNGQKIAYITNNIGRQRVYVADTDGKNRKLIKIHGYRNQLQTADKGYPLTAWSHSGNVLAVVYEERARIYYELYDTKTWKRTDKDVFPNIFQRVLSLDFMGNDGEAVLSAQSEGYSDLFLFRFKGSRMVNLTRDHYDDLSPVYFPYKGQKGILFSSNRPKTEVKINKTDSSLVAVPNLDIYYINAAEAPFEVWRATNTPAVSERSPMRLDSTRYTFLSDANGILNNYVGTFQKTKMGEKRIVSLKDKTKIEVLTDTIFKKIPKKLIDSVQVVPIYEMIGVNLPITDNTFGVSQQDIRALGAQGKAAEIYTSKYIHIRNFSANASTTLSPTFYRNATNALPPKKKETLRNELKIIDPLDTLSRIKDPAGGIGAKDTTGKKGAINLDNYTFQSEFDEPQTPAITINTDGSIAIQKPQIAPERKEAPEPLRFNSSKILPYISRFKTDYIRTMPIDNSMQFGGIDPYRGGNFVPPPLGIALQGSVIDQFEDHRLTAGVRVPYTFNGAEYFATYIDKTKRLDKIFSVYHRSQRWNYAIPLNQSGSQVYDGIARQKTTLVEAEGRYAISMFSSLRGKVYGRIDKQLPLTTDPISIQIQSDEAQRLGARTEFVFDNTIDAMVNIKYGTRAKIFVEALKSVSVDLDIEKPKFDFDKGFTTVAGFDARHYEQILGKSVLALRAAGATSFGSQRFLYFLGGVDNWLLPRYNNQIPVSNDPANVYQTLATNMRGFEYNIRNGNSYALVNAEVRIPVFWYFSRTPPKSQFLRDFQIVAFADAGAAWTGLTPFSNENPINTSIYGSRPPVIVVKVNYYRDPIVMSYGAGLRSTIFGMFCRLDLGYGIETGVRQAPLLHFSLGTDF